MILLWLDDLREAPKGWTHVTTVEAAQDLLKTGEVQKASLDHDLGYQLGEDGTIDKVYFRTGYDLVKWMAETNTWPKERPTVHSMNPVGRRNMEATIDRYFKENDNEE